jgi:hypothetical protein
MQMGWSATGRRAAVAGLVGAALLVGAVPALAKGGNGGNGGSGGNNQQQVSYVLSLNESDPHLGGTVTFTATYPKSSKNPRIQVMCSQAGVLVYGEAGASDQAFLLGGGSSLWLANGGPASCVVDSFDLVWNGNNMQEVTWIAEVAFDAAG